MSKPPADDAADAYWRGMLERDADFELDADDQRDLLFSYFRLRDELVPPAMEAYRALMGDNFDANVASRVPDVLRAHFGDIEDFHYE
jgi:hypothetical protein